MQGNSTVTDAETARATDSAPSPWEEGPHVKVPLSLKRPAQAGATPATGQHQQNDLGVHTAMLCISAGCKNCNSEPLPQTLSHTAVNKRQRTYAEIASPVAATTSPLSATTAAVLASPCPATSVPLDPLPEPATQYALHNLDELLLKIFVQEGCSDRQGLESLLHNGACTRHMHLKTLSSCSLPCL